MSYDPTPESSQPSAPGLVTDKNAQTWAMICHLAGFAKYVIPLGNIIGPLIVWNIKKSEHAFIDDQGKEALNFQISMTIYLLVAIVSIFCFVGIVVAPAIAIADVVFMIIAALKASQGESYRYPLTFRLVK